MIINEIFLAEVDHNPGGPSAAGQGGDVPVHEHQARDQPGVRDGQRPRRCTRPHEVPARLSSGITRILTGEFREQAGASRAPTPTKKIRGIVF